jgi:hypothetical protein
LVLFPAEARDFSLPQSASTDYGTTQPLIHGHWELSGWSVKLTTHFHPVLRLRMGVLPTYLDGVQRKPLILLDEGTKRYPNHLTL